MKRIRSFFCVLLVGLFFVPNFSLAQNSTLDVFSMMEDVLMKNHRSESQTWTAEEAIRVIETLETKGLSLPDQFVLDIESHAETNNGTVYKYTLIQKVLEISLGSYRSWAIEDKYRFDLLQVNLGLLKECINVLPEKGELTEDEALLAAMNALAERTQFQQGMLCNYTVNRFLNLMEEGGERIKVWRFGFVPRDANQDTFSVHIDVHGAVIAFEQLPLTTEVASVDDYYLLATEEKGAFFTWTLQEKADFARSLRNLMKGQDVLPEVRAIAETSFFMPPNEAISQEKAYEIALEATQHRFGLPNDWDADFNVYFSFFLDEEMRMVWRVIFWDNGIAGYSGGIVEMDATNGEVLTVEKNGNTVDTFITYLAVFLFTIPPTQSAPRRITPSGPKNKKTKEITILRSPRLV